MSSFNLRKGFRYLTTADYAKVNRDIIKATSAIMPGLKVFKYVTTLTEYPDGITITDAEHGLYVFVIDPEQQTFNIQFDFSPGYDFSYPPIIFYTYDKNALVGGSVTFNGGDGIAAARGDLIVCTLLPEFIPISIY